MSARLPQPHDILRQHYVARIVFTKVPVGEGIEYEAIVVDHTGMVVTLVVRVEGVRDPVPPLASSCGWFNIHV